MAELDQRRRLAFTLAAGVFAALTIFVGAVFVHRLVAAQEIRSGLFTYALFTGAAAVGLARRRRWGRNVALVIVIGNTGLGVLSTLAVLFAREGNLVGPVALTALGLVVSWVLARPIYDLPADAEMGAHPDD